MVGFDGFWWGKRWMKRGWGSRDLVGLKARGTGSREPKVPLLQQTVF